MRSSIRWSLVVAVVGLVTGPVRGASAGQERGAFDPVDTLAPLHLPSCLDPGPWYAECAVFGGSVATDGVLFVIGAPGQPLDEGNTTYVDVGAVYVASEAEDGSWPALELRGSDTDANDHFGSVVDVDAGRFVVSGKNQVYVYEPDGFGGWDETILADPTEPAGWSANAFGSDVAIDGGRLVVGGNTIWDDDFTFHRVAYVYEDGPGGWTQTARLLGLEYDFTPVVDVDGDRIVVGRTSRASVYTWDGANWDETDLLPPSDGSNHMYGDAVSVDGDVVFVSDWARDQTGAVYGGAVFAFAWNGSSWDRTEVSPPTGHVASGYFGSSLDASDGLLLVGARGENSGPEGGAYLFRYESGWIGEPLPESGLSSWGCENFGVSVGLGGGSLIVGASDVCSPGTYQGHGAANVYRECRGRVATLVGTPGADVIAGTSAADVIVGQARLDWIDAGAGDDLVCGGAGNDTIDGGPGADTLLGQSQVDFLSGGAGPDVLDGGGSLNDWAVFLDAPGGVTVTLPIGSTDGTATGDGTDTLISIENVKGSLFDDVIVGNPRDNKLYGYQGDDDIDGKAGDDIVDGGPGFDILQGHRGNDVITGGPGRDYAEFMEATGPATIDLTLGTASYATWSDVLAGIEHVRGSGHDDTIKGDGSNNILRGFPGNDELYGEGGFDYLFGGDGEDWAYGGADGANCFAENTSGC